MRRHAPLHCQPTELGVSVVYVLYPHMVFERVDSAEIPNMLILPDVTTKGFLDIEFLVIGPVERALSGLLFTYQQEIIL